MDYSTVQSLIGSLGFPIVAYGALFYWMVKLEQRHEEETTHLREVIESNTRAIERLCEKVGMQIEQ